MLDNSVKIRSLYFTGIRSVEVREETMAGQGAGSVLVRTLVSAISAGTEGLLYRGEFPPEMPLDDAIPALKHIGRFPVKYGYSTVGEVIDLGDGVDESWLGKRVFSFQPHQSHFVSGIDELQILPEGRGLADAVFYPSVETAATLLLDGAPLLGERVVLFGQGIVGLLLTNLLASMPLRTILTVEPSAMRRQASLQMGAQRSEAFFEKSFLTAEDSGYEGADLVYEISGNPEALNAAIDAAGYSGRIIVGSWYGQKKVQASLGGDFHRSRMKLISSQVSTIDPPLRGRWSKRRMSSLTWFLIRSIKPSRLISHTFSFDNAPEAYRLLDEQRDSCLQVVLKYPDGTP